MPGSITHSQYYVYIRANTVYQNIKMMVKDLKGKARANKIEDGPLRVRRKSGNRIRSDRRVVLHQKIELDYLITIKIFLSLAFKNNKTVM